MFMIFQIFDVRGVNIFAQTSIEYKTALNRANRGHPLKPGTATQKLAEEFRFFVNLEKNPRAPFKEKGGPLYV